MELFSSKELYSLADQLLSHLNCVLVLYQLLLVIIWNSLSNDVTLSDKYCHNSMEPSKNTRNHRFLNLALIIHYIFQEKFSDLPPVENSLLRMSDYKGSILIIYRIIFRNILVVW